MDADRSQSLFRRFASAPLNWLLLALPVAVWFDWQEGNGVALFVASGLAIMPLAGWMGKATEDLSSSLGANVGGLLNATFGNAAELIIGLMLLAQGPKMYPLVKASLTGSIIGNILLVLGASILAGGLRFHQQKFNRHAAGMGATLLALAAIGLVMPTLYYYVFRSQSKLTQEELDNVGSLSEEIAVVLAVIYVLSLVFSLGTHHRLVAGIDTERNHVPERGRLASLVILFAATAGVAWMSHMLVASVEHAAEALGMNHVFVGVIVVAIVGNAAEHSTAVSMALKNRLDVSVNIAIGSGMQIALLVAPLLVFASLFMGLPQPLDLHFTPLEMIAVLLAVGVMNLVSHDGESNWMEGVMLLGVYLILALAFYHLPGN